MIATKSYAYTKELMQNALEEALRADTDYIIFCSMNRSRRYDPRPLACLEYLKAKEQAR